MKKPRSNPKHIKYLITKNKDLIIFSDTLRHESMASDVGGRQAILGAGYIDKSWKVSGKSEMLQIGPSVFDQGIVDKFVNPPK